MVEMGEWAVIILYVLYVLVLGASGFVLARGIECHSASMETVAVCAFAVAAIGMPTAMAWVRGYRDGQR